MWVTDDVIIVGAGPSGLAAAIAAKQRGLDYLVLEKGSLVNSIYRFPPHMVFFTTPELLEIGGVPFVSPFEKPTRAEALRYYRRSWTRSICRSRMTRGARRSLREPDAAKSRETTIASSPSRRGRLAASRVRQRAMSSWRSATTIGRTARDSRRRSAARLALLHRAASLLPSARRHRRRQELGGEGGARTVPRRRARDARASRRRS